MFDGSSPMMLSTTRRYIFVANLKAASTSIEASLRSFSEIAIEESRYGKHAPFSLIQQRCKWLFDETKIEEFFVFGVIRDPVTFLLSLFNSHCDEKFSASPLLYTGNSNFASFLRNWVPLNYDQAKPQYSRFLDERGHLAMSFLVDYGLLQSGLERVAEHIDVPSLCQIKNENTSEQRLRADDITSAQMAWIRRHYANDYSLISRYSNHVLSSDEREGYKSIMVTQQEL